jgi:PKD repeat protein
MRKRQGRRNGQSLVEFALLLPAFLLIVLVAIDFGRVYLGWVNLQQMTRIAADFGSKNATAWALPDTARKQSQRDQYRQMVENDARLINCELPDDIPDPVFPTGFSMGDTVRVGIDCQFSLVTPIVSQIVGGEILASASSTYAVREGAVAAVPGGGGPTLPAPVADFVGSPRSGWAPLEVTFTDASTNGPTSWTWDFSVSSSGSGTPSDPGLSFDEGPMTVTYGCTGAPGDSCTYGVSLQVSNPGGFDTETRADYITVTVPPDTGPIADFVGTPQTGVEPLTVDFDFSEISPPGSVTYTEWQWDFQNDGTFDTTGRSASHTYPTDGEYDVRLRVTDNAGNANEVTKDAFVVVSNRICTVPDFATVRRNQAQQRWANAGFTTIVTFLPGQNNYKIQTQTLVGGTVDPQPNGCDSTITVGP